MTRWEGNGELTDDTWIIFAIWIIAAIIVAIWMGTQLC